MASTTDLSLPLVRSSRFMAECEEQMALDVWMARDLSIAEVEFQNLKRVTETRAHAENLYTAVVGLEDKKNRYCNVKPYVHSRVILSERSNSDSDYINASHVASAKAGSFIACQGPLPHTVNDFWSMVWDENCALIVMLCQLYEDTVPKCALYWPEGTTLDSGRFTVQQIHDTKSPVTEVLERKFVIREKSSGLERTVVHLHYVGWPDHSIPMEAMEAISYLISAMDGVHTGSIVVHCSAGIGRSGTLIAIYELIQRLLDQTRADPDSIPRISVFSVVRRLREKRFGMVQQKSQYTLIYQYLQLWIQTRMARYIQSADVTPKQ
eukprot:GILJ01006195.1.p1 GENE.GILJ01006195.1~~GILJ01006195.1.p1  ORF type:complete len:334 (+),score=27.70 GILJ01006195.1:36-1004(+)